MQFDNTRSLDLIDATPRPVAPPPPPDRSAWGAPWRALQAGAAEIAGSVADVAKGFGAASASIMDADPFASAVVGSKAVQEGVAEGRRQIATGEALVSGVGNSFRQVSRDLRPDTATASKAEELVFGVVRPLSKLVGAGLTMGPIGLGMAAAEEGFTQSDELRLQGVDQATRSGIGLLTAGANAAGAFLPMAGPTLKATAGLYLLGGPGAFMAQQQATRSILERADYGEIAKQYDPLDPIGLGMSMLIPLPFAAFGAARNIGASRAARQVGADLAAGRAPDGSAVPTEQAPPVPREVVDAAMVHNLTAHADAVEAAIAAGAPPFNLSPESTSAPQVAALPVGIKGATAEVVTERGLTAPVQYRLVEAGDLITSHTNDLTPTPAFPAELQPRDRTRAASADQIARIENAIRPELLGESVKASDGAPIIGPDGVVESGNARSIAVRRAYESGKADAYRAWLSENSTRFGLTPEQVAGMQRPVLVRERLGSIDRAEFARQANESSIAAMSQPEQAKADAARMTDLEGLVSNEDGSINMRESAGFLRRFMQAAVGPTERAGMLQADGRLSQAGQLRLRNAVFAKAYGDPALVAMLSESTDSNVRNVLNGLLRAAPDVARLNDLAAAGARQPVDVAGNVVRAVQEFAKLRADGMTVDQYLAQGNLLGDGLPPEVNNLLIGLGENSRAPRRVAEMVREMTRAVDGMGDPRQSSLLDGSPASAADVTANAVERLRAITDEQLTDTPPATVKASTDPLMRMVTDRVQGLEVTAPELPVRLDADGKPVSLADELAQVRKEAAEGTDVELGALDADLLRVAAECALSIGSA